MTGKPASAESTQWLVRKGRGVAADGSELDKTREEYQVLGPYLGDQVRLMVKEGVLEPEDEICPENGYWFCLHEKEEVQKYLGIDGLQSAAVPILTGEETQPDVQLASPEPESPTRALTRPEKPKPALPAGKPLAGVSHAAAPVQPVPSTPDQLRERFPRVSIAQSLGYYGQPKSPQILGVEKGKIWSLLFFILASVALLGVLWVLRSLKA